MSSSSSSFSNKTPDLIYYSDKKDLPDYDILEKSKNDTEYISTNLNIYADSKLTIPIGYITGRVLQDQNITSYTGYVKFTTFNGALTYYAVSDDYYSSIYIDTILAGSGNLLGATGYVVVIRNEDLDYLINYVYLEKK